MAKDTEARRRDIKSYNDTVFVGGALKEFDGDWWIELAGKVESHKLMSGSL
ncbi:hypothetical protein D3C81_2303920 [compost metagenome]